MYLSFYGLKLKPFQNSTNPSFFWFGEKQKETLAIFKYGISKMPGILLLTGDVGTGKTTLVNALLNNLDDQFIVIKVLDPGLEEIDFLNYLSDALDFKKKFSTKDNFFAHFSKFLNTSATLGKKVVLVIDECQRLNVQLLDEIVQLANIENDETKLLKVLLIGQNTFNDLLQNNKSKKLHQSIAINYAIAPLDIRETGDYVRHRLKIAGGKSSIFSADAFSKIYEFSTGIPRRINIICDHALLLGFAQEKKTINGDLIRECAMDLRPLANAQPLQNDSPESVTGDGSKKIRRSPPKLRQKVNVRRAGITFGMVILIMIPVFLITYFTPPRSYQKALQYFKRNGLQFFIDPHAADTQNRPFTSDSDIRKVASEIDAPRASTPFAKKPVGKEHPAEPAPKIADESVAPTGEPLQPNGIGADSLPEIADSPGETDTLPLIAPIEPSDKDVTSDNVAIPPAMPAAKKEVTTAADTSAVPDAKENSMQETGLLEQQETSQMNLTRTMETSTKTQGDLPDTANSPSQPPKEQDVSDEPPPEPIDPGAVIDWVLKNRSR
ncbi:AAA family ATPase [Desulfopila sp. IMCC35006]|uniref:ExeA family protein n=1 Tax=Desulfopila sp. IMCC35006 TaxID=2569542 RepID=UPI0010ABCB65|nr:AAA family ATPase [Desulfopila sp. IMCC35006]TKB25940.1 AAA family ATPase [Desulfopila sp. IMCC35006]